MRITSGSLKGRTITVPTGEEIRPTSDRARLALFNCLIHGRDFPQFSGCGFLDGYCGSGAVGIEAFSRGAERVLLLDRDIRAASINLEKLGLGDSISIQYQDLTKTIAPKSVLSHQQSWIDFAYLDPPYGSGFCKQSLPILKTNGWLCPNAIIVCEIERTEPNPIAEGFSIIDERIYGRAKLVFYRSE